MFYSIIIPLYNKELFIKDTLINVINQSFKDFEIIVVDDGSTDNSVSIVNKISDKRLKVYSKANGGVSSARNFGIAKAKGDYIAFLDADDYWDNDYLAKMHQVITKNDAKLYCCCNAEILSSGKVIINPVKATLTDKSCVLDYQKLFLSTNISPIHTSAVIISSDIIKKYSFDENIIMGEDLLLWFQITLNHKCIIVNEVLSFYNRSDANAATAKLAPFKKTFIPTLYEWNVGEYCYNKKLLTRLILNMIKPYYMLEYNIEIKNIIKSCNMDYATLLQKIIYKFLPRIIAKSIWRIVIKVYKS